ncbi:MAG: DoxX family protein [Acidobacteriota bacterium]
MGLLLLRALVGCSLIIQGAAYIQSPNRSLAMWGVAAFAFTCGALLLVGLMTPLVAVLVVIGGIGIVLSWIPSPDKDLFDSYPAIINLIGLSLAIAFLGPGAFSLDARMFGRREITIPTNSHVARP